MEEQISKEKVYEAMYQFKLTACRLYTNCTICPWGKRVDYEGTFKNSYYYDCKLKEFTEEELIESVNENKEFLISKLLLISQNQESEHIKKLIALLEVSE